MCIHAERLIIAVSINNNNNDNNNNSNNDDDNDNIIIITHCKHKLNYLPCMLIS